MNQVKVLRLIGLLVAIYLPPVFAQIMIPHPAVDATLENLRRMNIENAEDFCQSPVDVELAYLTPGMASIPKNFVMPNFGICVDHKLSRLIAAYAEPSESWLEEHGFQFSYYYWPKPRYRNIYTDLVQDGLGNFWVSDMNHDTIIQIQWNWQNLEIEAVEQPSSYQSVKAPVSLALDRELSAQSNPPLEMFVLEKYENRIQVLSLPSMSQKVSRVNPLFGSFEKLATNWNPHQSIYYQRNYFFALSPTALYRINRQDLSVVDSLVFDVSGMTPGDINVDGRGSVYVSDKYNGSVYAFFPGLSENLLWRTAVKGSDYYLGQLPVYAQIRSIDQYYNYLLVAEAVKDSTGIRAHVLTEREEVKPVLVSVEDDCQGGKVATFGGISSNPGKICYHESESVVVTDGVRKEYEMCFWPSGGYRIVVPFAGEAEWTLAGQSVSTEGVTPSNKCPIADKDIEIWVEKIERVCGSVLDGYMVYLGYNNPNDFLIELPYGHTASNNYYPISWSPRPINQFKPGRHIAGEGEHLPVYVSMEKIQETGVDISQFKWNLLDQRASAYGIEVTDECSLPAGKMELLARDDGWQESNIVKPRIHFQNISEEPLAGLSVRFWLSRSEYPEQQFIVDKYWSSPSEIILQLGEKLEHEYVEAQFPANFILEAGSWWGDQNLQFGIHFSGYWPGIFNKSNDWSFAEIGKDYMPNSHITVYSNGELIYGLEPMGAEIPSSSSLASSSSSFQSSSSAGGTSSATLCSQPGESSECPAILTKNNEILVALSSGEEFWVQASSWPGKLNEWWSPDVVLHLNNTGQEIPDVEFTVNGKTPEVFDACWWREIDIPDEGPYLMRFSSQEQAKFLLKFSTRAVVTWRDSR